MSEDTMVVNGATYPVAFSRVVVKNGIEVTIKGCLVRENVMFLAGSDGKNEWSVASLNNPEDIEKMSNMVIDRLVQVAEFNRGMDRMRAVKPEVEREINEILKKYDVAIEGNYDGRAEIWFPYEPFTFDRGEE